jgi:Bacterial Ig-like domain
MIGPVSGSVRIGRYALEIGAATESYVAFEPEREDQNTTALGDALAEDTEEVPRSIAAVEEFQEHAQTVTAKIERAHELFSAAAEGRLLDTDPLVAEVDSLLGLAERLDRGGRFEEELRLLRALHGLLVLTRRWLDLIRGLRRGLSAAEEAGDHAAQAWVRHELGSLHLCADEPEAAAEQLGRALRLQQRLGQATGACATRHNLDSAQRDLATPPASKPWLSRRLPRLAVVASALTLVALGTGMALALGEDSSSSTTSTTTPASTTTATSDPTDTTTSTQGPIDVTPPFVTLDEPSDGSVIEPGTPVFSGTAGVEPGDAGEVLVEIVEIVDGNTRRPLAGSPLSASVVDGTWTATPTSALTDGAYEATARQSDNAGNSDSATISFSVRSLTPTSTSSTTTSTSTSTSASTSTTASTSITTSPPVPN